MPRCKASPGDWLSATPGVPLIACGMVGSAQGWREAPYVLCPASADSLVSGLTVFDVGGGARLHIVPGVRNQRPNVMRGEETQVVGALALAPQLSAWATLLMPGTHSKWVDLRDGRLDDFRTFMTGELFAVLRDHSTWGELRGGPLRHRAFVRCLRPWRGRRDAAWQCNSPACSAPARWC